MWWWWHGLSQYRVIVYRHSDNGEQATLEQCTSSTEDTRDLGARMKNNRWLQLLEFPSALLAIRANYVVQQQRTATILPEETNCSSTSGRTWSLSGSHRTRKGTATGKDPWRIVGDKTRRTERRGGRRTDDEKEGDKEETNEEKGKKERRMTSTRRTKRRRRTKKKGRKKTAGLHYSNKSRHKYFFPSTCFGILLFCYVLQQQTVNGSRRFEGTCFLHPQDWIAISSYYWVKQRRFSLNQQKSHPRLWMTLLRTA